MPGGASERARQKEDEKRSSQDEAWVVVVEEKNARREGNRSKPVSGLPRVLLTVKDVKSSGFAGGRGRAMAAFEKIRGNISCFLHLLTFSINKRSVLECRFCLRTVSEDSPSQIQRLFVCVHDCLRVVPLSSRDNDPKGKPNDLCSPPAQSHALPNVAKQQPRHLTARWLFAAAGDAHGQRRETQRASERACVRASAGTSAGEGATLAGVSVVGRKTVHGHVGGQPDHNSGPTGGGFRERAECCPPRGEVFTGPRATNQVARQARGVCCGCGFFF